MKSIIVLLALVASCSAASVDARPKRSLVVAAPVVAASVPVVAASVPVVRSAVVHTNPTTVVKTEQVHSGGASSYSYSTETKAAPAVVHSVAAAPVVHHTVPTYAYGYYPSYYPSYSYYSPYSYVVGK